MMLHLRGNIATSRFRLGKLEVEIRPRLPGFRSIIGEYIHLVDLGAELNGEQRRVLEMLLDYGPRERSSSRRGESFIVVPRIGTISPWSTKATDIAHRCGLHQIHRIERGIEWSVTTDPSINLTERDLALIGAAVHDPMTESVLPDVSLAEQLFHVFEPAPLAVVNVLQDGRDALDRANQEWGLALSDSEIDYLTEQFSNSKRNPTDVELMMFAQVNSEHCRHKIFNANWVIDGYPRQETLFNMIRETHASNGAGTLVAYSDNSAVLQGTTAKRWFPDPETSRYGFVEEPVHIVCKVETHNHPTGISPFPGAATGSGGEIRDEGATGIGAKPKAGLTGFSVSNLRLPGAIRPWEGQARSPERLASPLQIMLEGPIGGASFNNEFGRPNILGYFRTYEQPIGLRDGVQQKRGYHKPIMLAGGLGNIRPQHVTKKDIPVGARVVVLGGPAMMIGLGGGAASSLATGSSDEALDYSSVQRGNPEMQRRCQEVIDRCWERGEQNPILSVHDVGAGGLSNAIPELVHASDRGADLQIRKVLNDDRGMTPMQIWCNEAQERYAIAVAPERLDEFIELCERERCLYCVIGSATEEQHLLVQDDCFGDDGEQRHEPINMPMATLFGNAPKMLRNSSGNAPVLVPGRFDGVTVREALYRVLRLPTVADKTFLVTIADRSVGGLVSRDQMVGPWQVPVADVGVTCSSFCSYAGEAMALGERTPLAVIDAPASGRVAVAEALLNLAAADVRSISEIKLSANWMAAADHESDDYDLFQTVSAVSKLCIELGISIPVGKDSMSMKTVWQDDDQAQEVIAPVSLIASAFAPVTDVRKTLTPRIAPDPNCPLWLIDLGSKRLGGSALNQVFGQTGDESVDVDDSGLLKNTLLALQEMVRNKWIGSYHDRSDGGVITTLLEMCFAGRTGLDVMLPELADHGVLASLFNEEPGAVIQVDPIHQDQVNAVLARYGIAERVAKIATPRTGDQVRVLVGDTVILEESRVELHRVWAETSRDMQKLRDNAQCANEEHDRLLDTRDPGLHAVLTFDPSHGDAPADMLTRPRVAILREQGVNGQLEMAAAFHRAGFDTVDVPMSDLARRQTSLADFQGLAACGGFSFGDVLGAGGGWARSILFNTAIRDQFEQFFERPETFTFGVCNGCQMLAALKEIIPGAAHWPRFVRNFSEQFEARYVMVEVTPSPSILLRDMAGSRLPVVVSHGEGRVEIDTDQQQKRLMNKTALRFVDNHGDVAETYPYNPNGSPAGITGLSNDDGRVTVMMPHPERVFRTVQCSWAPGEWGEDSGWMKLFRNARSFID